MIVGGGGGKKCGIYRFSKIDCSVWGGGTVLILILEMFILFLNGWGGGILFYTYGG